MALHCYEYARIFAPDELKSRYVEGEFNIGRGKIKKNYKQGLFLGKDRVKKKKLKAATAAVAKCGTTKGKEVARFIKDYCEENGLTLGVYFPSQQWATLLGDGWYMPGNYELELMAPALYSGYNVGDIVEYVKPKEQADFLEQDLFRKRLYETCPYFSASEKYGKIYPIQADNICYSAWVASSNYSYFNKREVSDWPDWLSIGKTSQLSKKGTLRINPGSKAEKGQKWFAEGRGYIRGEKKQYIFLAPAPLTTMQISYRWSETYPAMFLPVMDF